MQNAKHKTLRALFAEAKKLGISQEMLREDIAPVAINKRLSQATPQEIAFLLDHLKGNSKNETNWKYKRYESSRRGLLQEIADLAKQRFGEDFIRPLNALCERFKVEGYRSLRVNQAKAVKATLIRLQREDPRNIHRKDAEGAEEKQEAGSPIKSGTKQETQNAKVIIFHKGRKGFLNQLGELDNI